MSEFGDELARLMQARGVGVRELARRTHYNAGHISNLRTGRAGPSPELAANLDAALGARGALAAFVPAPGSRARHPPVTGDQDADDEIAAFELGRRAEASDVGNGTVERLKLAVDDLATAYPGTSPGELLGRVRAHLGSPQPDARWPPATATGRSLWYVRCRPGTRRPSSAAG